MKDPIGGVSTAGADVGGVSSNVAGEVVTVSRKEVTKENTFKKFLAMLAGTVLSFRTTARENCDSGQAFVNNINPGVILSPNQGRLSAVIRNIGGQNVYIGQENVTVNSGFLLRPFESITLDKTWGSIYGISDNVNGTNVCYVEE